MSCFSLISRRRVRRDHTYSHTSAPEPAIALSPTGLHTLPIPVSAKSDFRQCPEWAGSSPDLSSGLMAGAGRRLAPFVTAILASGYDSSPGVGPGGRGFHWSRGCPSWVAGAVHAGQGP